MQRWKKRKELIDYAKSICQDVLSTPLPPLHAINHHIPLIDPNKKHTWCPSKCSGTLRPFVVGIMFAPSSRPLIHTPVVATPAYIASQLLAMLSEHPHGHLPPTFSLPRAVCHIARYCAILHCHDSSSATLPSGQYMQLLHLLYLVRFELVGLYTACTSHIPSSLRVIPHNCASVPWCCNTVVR